MALEISPEIFNRTPSRYHTGASAPALTGTDYSRYVHANISFIEYHQLSFALYAAALLCCCVFWVYGVRHIRNITLAQSLASVVLPVAVYLAFLLGTNIVQGWVGGFV
jgi:hypothetical protein